MTRSCYRATSVIFPGPGCFGFGKFFILGGYFMNNSKLRRMTAAALFGAMAFILMLFAFSVPVISVFAEFDASGLVEMIGGFILGPVGAVEIITVKLLLKILFKGSSSMLTGEIQNFILSVSYVLPAVFYYQRHKTKKGAMIGLVLGTVSSIIMAVITNLYFVFPIYIKLYGMNWDGIIEMCSEVNPWITNIPTFVAFSVVPFNVISRGVISFVTMLVYKRISKVIKRLIEG